MVHERRLLELFIADAPAAIAMFDDHMRYLAVSRRWMRDYGLTGEVIGRSHYEVLPEIPERWRDVHRRTLQGETLSAEEDRFVRADGSVQYVRWETRPWVRDDGSIGGIVITTEDVTQVVDARHALEAARNEAERANRAKDEFVAMLGHELRNPLSPILTAVHLLRRRGADGLDAKLDIIERQARHMVRLVDDLLDVSRIARGKVTLSRERMELGDVVAKAVELATPVIEGNRHALKVDVPRTGLSIDADPIRMAQVVSNLLGNAAKYTPHGGHIAVRARREGDHAVLVVEDDGIGIDPELLPRIFNLFEQGQQPSDRTQGGLGLGLSIVKSLVELHGGDVRAESAGVGRGSRFTVHVPIADGVRSEVARPADVLAAPREDGLHILVVDDNQDAARLLGETLTSMGHEVDVAFDARRALELADLHPPDVALLDLGLPVMDGFELARRLRPGARGRPCLVAVTGYGQESDRRRTTEAGFSAHLVKPVDPARLEAVIRDELAHFARGGAEALR